MGQLTMLKDFKSLPAIEKAIRLAGGISTLANELSVTNTTIYNWRKKPESIPPERAKQIEDFSGGLVTRTELRPDLFA
ncbi:hypothetical protein AVI51_16965 (plasmid) [Piscirickettsia salmonis]|uniref:DNA-binding protein n=2 Tax=Piscirickettsia salmonis TaxID=1238 RepID=A0A095BM21_PISSA|nr:YdaS family helix-turn-helix protein [Piscirickettsia salmonis]RNC77164.1 Cro/Cl family transcriptional regulator [Piscirickettsiaceae bacterium NZ-RLO2]ALA26587.1 DNA-binding protein [Piscirickettsia salmonis]ALB24423.1 DNA-binding protein [Piscirickettsia salmonis]ALT18940.1 hypothetical protein PSLF89_08905 [Piscirickettsia salmonis LF-89 = ATCC VR-1361]ALY04611.1 hypothetical protein AWE47_17010 [Piscirickettsia salmonis]